MIYTVIGVYDEDGQVFAESVEAENPQDAAAKVSAGLEECVRGELQIVAIVPGEVEVYAPCEEGEGKASYASDLAEAYAQ